MNEIVTGSIPTCKKYGIKNYTKYEDEDDEGVVVMVDVDGDREMYDFVLESTKMNKQLIEAEQWMDALI